MTERHVVGFPSLQDGDGKRRPLAPVRTQVQRCAVCRGGGQLGREHEFWEYTVRSPYDRQELDPPPASDIKRMARQLYEDHHGRCPGCGGSGRVIIYYSVGENGRTQVQGIMHYHPDKKAGEDLLYLKKLNPSA